jgi:ferredoxin
MTPFGIRKKIKALLGLGGQTTPSAPERPRYTVIFQLPNGEDYRVEAKEGDSLVLASGRGAYPIATGCSDGTCATCRVEVLEGLESLSQADEFENKTKTSNEVDLSLRLGCQAAILGSGVKVRIINVLGEELVEG